MRVFPPADEEHVKNNIHNFQENFSASAKCAKQSQKCASEIEDLQSRLLPLCLGQLIQNCLLCLFAVAAAPIGVPASLCLFALSLGPVCAPLLCRPAKRRLLLLAHALGCGWLFLLMASICVWLAHYIRQNTTSSSRQPSLELKCVFVPTFLLANLALCLFWLQRLIVVFLPIWWRGREEPIRQMC